MFVLENPITEIPPYRNLIPFPQENISIGNLLTATGIRASLVISHLSFNRITIYDPYEKYNLFNIQFANVSTLPDEKFNNVNFPNFSFVTNRGLNPLVVEQFIVYSVLVNLNHTKCKDFRNLPNRLLKSCSQSLATPLGLLFNFILATKQFPLQWKTASILPLHKEGSCHDVMNYPPVALLLYLVFEKLGDKHLYSQLDLTIC